MEENNKITNAGLSFSCNQDWNSMNKHADGNRFCSSCEKMVYDLTDKNVAYFLRIMEENNNNVCGMFSSDQLFTPVHSDHSIWKKWVIAAMVFIGMGSLINKANAQNGKLGEVRKDSLDCRKTDIQMSFLGKVVCTVDPVDHILFNYVVQKYKAPAIEGRLIISFNLRKDGSISHLAVNNHLSKKVSDEVLRLIKTAPISKLASKEELEQSPMSHSLYLTFAKGKILNY